MVVYLDVLLAVNWVIDFLLLHATARVMSVPYKGWRAVMGAALGAAFAAGTLFFELPSILSAATKLAAAVAMVAVTFGRRMMFRRTAVLFVISTAAAGVTAAVWWLWAPQGLALINGVIYYDIPPLVLVALVVAAYGLFCVYDRITRRRTAAATAYRLCMERAGKSVEVAAMYDSGNRLAEPFSGAPVAVVTYHAAAPLLSPAWQGELPPGARMIPFASLGGEGVLPAFCPDRLTVKSERGAWDATGSFVAVTHRPLCGEYEALIGTAILQNEPTCRNKKGETVCG